jgi:sigma-B regulation protein RsbU (phosphoserine phosphatase)
MNDMPVNILLIEDLPEYANLIREMLRKAKGALFQVEWEETLGKGLARLARGPADLILLDLSLEDSEGLATFERVHAQAPDLPIIVFSSLDDENIAIQALHEGAQDYLVKGQVDRNLLVRSIRYAIERNRTEAALEQAERKYRGIFEHIVEGIFQTTPDGRYLSANPALARIYGYESPGELIATVTDIARSIYVEPNRRAEFVRLMEEHDVVTGFESQVFRKDGSVIWISENVRAVRDAQGRLLCYEGTVEDITERKHAQEKLRDSEALYHSLVETLPQNILRKDLQERFTFANRRFCKTLGRPLEEILGKTDFDFFPPELAAKYQRDDRQVMESGTTFEAVEEHQPPGRGKMFVQVVKTPLYDAQGNIIGLQGIFWDITERIQAEQRIQQANAELTVSREALRQKNTQMENDLKMAHEVQQSFLPQQYPTFPGGVAPQDSALHFFHRFNPSGSVSGDFFTVVRLSDTEAGVFICDVMGHGVRSALITAMVRALVEELRPLARDPGQFLSQLNHDLGAILHQSDTQMFTSAFYLVADLVAEVIRFANAGHPRPLLIHHGSREVEPLAYADGKSRPALGLFTDSSYPTTQCSLQPGDLVMLFTDGLYDVEGPQAEVFGPEWVLAEVRKRAGLPAPELFEALLAEIQRVAGDTKFGDDVCLVGMEYDGTIPPAAAHAPAKTE